MANIFEDDFSKITEIDLVSEVVEEGTNEPNKNSPKKKRNGGKNEVEKENTEENLEFVRVNFGLSKEIYRQFSLLCFLKEISMSDFMRECISKGIKEFLKEPEIKKIFDIKFGRENEKERK